MCHGATVTVPVMMKSCPPASGGFRSVDQIMIKAGSPAVCPLAIMVQRTKTSGSIDRHTVTGLQGHPSPMAVESESGTQSAAHQTCSEI
jgi:hypothetical protein